MGLGFSGPLSPLHSFLSSSDSVWETVWQNSEHTGRGLCTWTLSCSFLHDMRHLSCSHTLTQPLSKLGEPGWAGPAKKIKETERCEMPAGEKYFRYYFSHFSGDMCPMNVKTPHWQTGSELRLILNLFLDPDVTWGLALLSAMPSWMQQAACK